MYSGVHRRSIGVLLFRELKLCANRLSSFPLELTLLPRLDVLDLSLNQVTSAFDTVLKGLIQRIRKTLESCKIGLYGALSIQVGVFR